MTTVKPQQVSDDRDEDGPDWPTISGAAAFVAVAGLVLGFVMSAMHWSQNYWWPIGLAVGLAVTAWVTFQWREAVVRYVLVWLALFAGVVFACAVIGLPIWWINQRNELSGITMPTLTMPTLTMPTVATTPSTTPDADSRFIAQLVQHDYLDNTNNGPDTTALTRIGRSVCYTQSEQDISARLTPVWLGIQPWQVEYFIRYAREAYCPNH